METFVKILIIIHVSTGMLSILAGPLAAASKKGGRVHRLAGKIFTYSMIITAILALIVSVLPGHQNLFLFAIGIFGLYLVTSGFRVLKLKRLGRGQHAGILDWALTLMMGIFALIMLCYGTWLVWFGSTFGFILLVFGGFGTLLAKDDIKLYTRTPEDPAFWLYDHINKMNGGLITAFTALLVNNNSFLPPLMAWLLPTLLGTFLGIYWTRKYKGKAKPKVQGV